MEIQIITLFPEMFQGILSSSMLYKAERTGAVKYRLVNLRDFGYGPRHQVDDTPYGGGDGMLLMVGPLVAAIEEAKKRDPSAKVILPTPRGEMYRQPHARKLASAHKGLIIVCPRYEGYDERVTNWVDRQYCIGPYILTGGELPAMILIDSVVRLLPGVLGGEQSAAIESFEGDGSLEYPQYTRPEEFRGLSVPEVLLSGHHAQIEQWRNQQRHPA